MLSMATAPMSAHLRIKTSRRTGRSSVEQALPECMPRIPVMTASGGADIHLRQPGGEHPVPFHEAIGMAEAQIKRGRCRPSFEIGLKPNEHALLRRCRSRARCGPCAETASLGQFSYR